MGSSRLQGGGKDMFVHISTVEQAGLIGMSLLSVGGAASRPSQHLEVRKAGLKCDRVSADTRPTELRLALTSNTTL
jgi:hypothetical protein